MTAGDFVDLVAKNYDLYLDRLSKSGFKKKVQGKGISKGAKMKGFDPNTEKGRKWWINGMGKSSEDELVVEQFAVLIAPSDDYHEYFQI